MPSTYAAYYNLVEAEKSAAAARRRSSNQSTASEASVASHKSSKFSLKQALKQLRPTREALTPAGIYGPIIQQGPLFGSKKSTGKIEQLKA
ncbi:hypothetical protein A1O1_09250 [Capronia coronata CBS 617.96]|uniref:Uncharacterized protein n=1 Tax=Capronia coronata CBS 617.96 TaxID=1182541 RepID=W9XF85_9EURO|nr:uncharacterized protein A1O1_09250 [Capronia coronata CBS 617.96]EXJ78848.1 hypothetical protein A1O1_09250 [Capronia coronata CBS 617.96]